MFLCVRIPPPPHFGYAQGKYCITYTCVRKYKSHIHVCVNVIGECLGYVSHIHVCVNVIRECVIQGGEDP